MLALGQLGLAWRPDIVHCNDWQSALIPVFLADSQDAPKTVFTIHNLAYQGLFSHETFRALGLPDSLWRYEFLEFHGQLSFIKGGLVFSDAITTVSPSYADEIQTPWFGNGLEGLLRHKSSRLHGILNGIDTRQWNPEADPHLEFHYGADYPANKSQCQARLQQELGLEVCGAPLLGFVGRLVEQKGLDWLLGVIKPLLERGCQFALLGSGEHHHTDGLTQAVGQAANAADHLVCVARVYICPDVQFNGLVELGGGHFLEEFHGLQRDVVFFQVHLFRDGGVPPTVLDHGCYSPTSMPMLRAVPAIICIASSTPPALRSANLDSAISLSCFLLMLPTLPSRNSEAPFSTPAALRNMSDAGGVRVTKVNERSS